jgi:DnaJ-class molecular chaperone
MSHENDTRQEVCLRCGGSGIDPDATEGNTYTCVYCFGHGQTSVANKDTTIQTREMS